jgi:DNA-binding winged helix-turn-helix (wHTH) protein/predicted ATPase
VFVFEDFELDEDLFELRRGGERVALRPQALDVLLYLVRHRERVVTKDELRVQIWSGATVSDTALPQAIVAVRRALGDEGDDPRLIRTIRARGYRFVGEPSVLERGGPRPRESQPPVSSSLATLPFVGREKLLETTRGFVTRAAKGEGGVVLVSGPVGSGKTRALLEIGTLARQMGATLATGRCYDDEGVPALWPWISVFRALATTHPAQSARVLDALATGGPNDARFTTFDVVTSALVNVAAATPLVVVLDDLHWADPASLLLAKLVAQSFHGVRALLVASHRDNLGDNKVLARTVGALAREEPARCVVLEPLDRGAVAELGAAALGHDIDAEALARLENKSAGSPLFLTQILHAIRSDERLAPFAQGSTSALLAVDKMREAVVFHLTDLSEDCTLVLTAASVLERDFTVTSLARMTARPASAVMAAIDEALGRKILRRADGASFAFVHVLVRDVLYKQLGIAKRVELHEAAAAALAELGDTAGVAIHSARVAALVG